MVFGAQLARRSAARHTATHGGSPNSEPRLPHGSRSADKQISEPPLKNSKAAKQKRNSLNSSSLASPPFGCGRTVDPNRNRKVVNRSFRPRGVFYIFYFCAKSPENYVFFIFSPETGPKPLEVDLVCTGRVKPGLRMFKNIQKQPLGQKRPFGENHEVPSMFTGSLVQEKVPYYCKCPAAKT